MTSAILDKSRKIENYIKDGIIPDNEPVIIVINDSLFFQLDVFMVGLTVEIFNGISGKPLAIEALLGLDSPVYKKLESSNNSYLDLENKKPSSKG